MVILKRRRINGVQTGYRALSGPLVVSFLLKSHELDIDDVIFALADLSICELGY